jgi:CBS domain-containing protein
MSDKRYDGDYPTVKASLPRDAQFEAPKVMLARDIMTKRLITVGPEAMVMDVVNLLSQHKITGVPVVGTEGELLGIVSEKDTFKLILDGGFNQSLAGAVDRVMSKNITTVKPSDDVFLIANLFYKNNYRRLPVVENGKVVGLISRRDILECIKSMGH